MWWLLRFVGRWPLPLLHALGALLGWLAWLLAPPYRRRWQAHTRLAGLRGWARWASVAHAGMMAAELPRLWFGPRVPIAWHGAEHIESAIARGHGMLFLTPHLGSFEVTAQAYAARFGSGLQGVHGGLPRPMSVLYRPPRKAWLQDLVDAARQRPGLRAVPTTLAGVRQLIQSLKAGEAVGLLPDQVPPKGLGVWAPFYGQPAYTMTLSARFARTPGAELLLAWGQRLPWGQGFAIHVLPWASVMPQPLADEPAAAAEQINRAMQALIERCPEQYLWGYARFKSPRQAL